MIRRFLALVPRPAQITAVAVMATETLAGFILGTFWQRISGMPTDSGPAMYATEIGLGLGLLFGCLSAIWVLCLGFVYTDSRRRMMRAWLWVLVAACIPHLVGFLLYFLLRQPIAAYCVHCGATIASAQRFCPWCGAAQVGALGQMTTPGVDLPGQAHS